MWLCRAQAPDPDLNNDGVVNILDVSLVSSCLGSDIRLTTPTLAITEPADGASLNSKLITVRGSIDAPFPPRVFVNDKPVTVTGGTFAANVELNQGDNL